MLIKKESPLVLGANHRGDNQKTNNNISCNNQNVKLKKQEKLKKFYTLLSLQSNIQKNLLKLYPHMNNTNYAKCHRVPLGAFVSLVRDETSGNAYYNHLVTCGNAMCCPVCASKIGFERSKEIKQAVQSWFNQDTNNTCYLITLTFAHTNKDNLKDLLKSFKAALKKFWANGTLKRLLKQSNRVGRITSTEIQYSKNNGWHPHQHILLFCQKTDFNNDFLAQNWVNALSSAGLTGLNDIAFNIHECREYEEYLTKTSAEMALGNLKQGRSSGHYSPFQLLSEANDGYQWALDRFLELFFAVRGLHSLYWSKGLKEFFNIKNITDEDICNADDSKEMEVFMVFESDYFKLLDVSYKSILQYYAGINDYFSAGILLQKLGIPYAKSSQLLINRRF